MCGNSYYTTGSERAARVQALFGAIASRYDLINDIQSLGLHRCWKRRLVAMARPKPGDQVVDLCCGTGDVAFRFARAGAQVVGVDFNTAMIEVAERRRQALGAIVGGVTFKPGDACQLPLESACADVVTISYGLRNLADPRRGLAEMRRILRPGGQLLILDFGKPEQTVLKMVYFAYLRSVVPLFGRVFCGDWRAYAYILESLQHYPAQQGVSDWMVQSGFREVIITDLLGGIMSIHRGIAERF